MIAFLSIFFGIVVIWDCTVIIYKSVLERDQFVIFLNWKKNILNRCYSNHHSIFSKIISEGENVSRVG